MTEPVRSPLVKERPCEFCGYPKAVNHYGDFYCDDCHDAVMGVRVAERIKDIWEIPQ